MNDALRALYGVIADRKENPSEKSYTRYLFESGLDKILKKCAEECGEVIIAAKNGIKIDTVNEIGDLLYHVLVLMVQQGITLEELKGTIRERAQKTGNLKLPRDSGE